MYDYDIEEAMGGSSEYNPFSISDYINAQTIFPIIISAIIISLTLIGMWKLFEKFGHKGWKAIIPVYNLIILSKIADKKPYYVLLYFIPIVNLFFLFNTYKAIFNKLNLGNVYPILTTIFPFIMLPVIGFNKKIVCPEQYLYKEETVNKVVNDVNQILNNNQNDNYQFYNMQEPNTMNQNVYDQNMQDPNMMNQNVYDQNMQGPNMMNQNMYDQNMQGPNMMNQNVYDQNMQGLNMMNQNVYDQNMQGPNMMNQNVYDQNMQDPNMMNQNVYDQNMQDPNMMNQNVYDQNMQDPNMMN